MQSEKRVCVLIAVLIFLIPLFVLIVRTNTENFPLSPDERAYTMEPEALAVESESASMSSADTCMPVEVIEEISDTETTKVVAPVRYAITDYERDQIERMVASEGGYCPYEFQALVAECILNGAEKDGLRPLELFERGDYWMTHDLEPTETTKQAVSDVFDRGIMPTEEKIFCYYNPNYCDSAAHEAQRYVLTCCDCRFFAEWDD